MKRDVNIFEHMKTISDLMPGPGILVTTKAGDKSNVMTIGWGTLGIEWGTPIFTIYIRKSRYTFELLEKNPEFTVCIPANVDDSKIRKALALCGSKTGRDVDKFEAAGLTVVEPELVKTPAIKEFPLTIECKVVFKMEQPVANLDSKFAKFYPEPTDEHIAFYGEIVKSYVIE